MTHDLLTRREVLGLFGAVAVASRGFAAQASKLDFSGLDHIEFYVSNVEKSRDFFVRIFGNTVLRGSTGKRYLKLGATYMAFEQPRGNAGIQVDHFSVGIKQLNMSALHALLEQQGIVYRDYPSGRDTAVTDPDGTRTQLSPENGWSFLKPPNFNPESVPVSQEPIFRPVGLDHVLLNVTDPEKAAGFYEKVLGPVSQRNNNRIWFQVGASRVGLLQTPAGQRAGVNHFCVSAEPFDYEAVIRRLQQMGAKLETSEVAGAPQFRDPDGSLIQVLARPA